MVGSSGKELDKLKKAAREAVRDDQALVSEVASDVSACLGLSAPNQTLGRKVILAAVDAWMKSNKAGSETGSEGGGRDMFETAAKIYGTLPSTSLHKIYDATTSRFQAIFYQMENQSMRRSGGNAAADTFAASNDAGRGFEVGTRERFMDGTRLVGGLQKKKRSEGGGKELLSSKTSSSSERRSVLGLDKLAQEKRKIREAEHQERSGGGDSSMFNVIRDDDNNLKDGGGIPFSTQNRKNENGWERKTSSSVKRRRDGHRRTQVPDTPSHPGGVNRSTKRRTDEKHRRKVNINRPRTSTTMTKSGGEDWEHLEPDERPMRRGLGADSNEWGAPERLSSTTPLIIRSESLDDSNPKMSRPHGKVIPDTPGDWKKETRVAPQGKSSSLLLLFLYYLSIHNPIYRGVLLSSIDWVRDTTVITIELSSCLF